MFDNEETLKLSHLIDIELLQELQDAFAKIMGVASLTVDSDGPITKPSNFTDFCSKYTRGTTEGYKRCNACDIRWGKVAAKTGKPIIYNCHAGLRDFAVPIVIEGKHIASILGGQVFTEKPNEEHFKALAREFGIDEDEYIEALRKIKIVPAETVDSAASFLYLVANIISEMGNKNLELIKKNLREALLREITEKIRSSLNINEILNFICDEAARIFNVQRASIAEFPTSENYENYRVRREFKNIQEIKGISNLSYLPQVAAYWGYHLLEKDEIIVINNISESDAPDYFKESYEALGAKSIIGFPIKKGNDNWGILVLTDYNNYRIWKNDEIELAKSITSQIYVAIKQSQLYEKEKQTAKREKLIASIIIKLLSNLNIDPMPQILNEIAVFTKADRCYFVEVDLQTLKGKPIDKSNEYLSSSALKSIVGYEFSAKKAKTFIDLYLKIKDIAVFDYAKLKMENKEEYLEIIQYGERFDLKSGIGIPFYYGDTLVAVLAIEYINEKRLPTNEELDFLRILGNQVGIAFKQVQLYQTTKQTAEREVLLRGIAETIRGSFDINETTKKIVTEIGKMVKADRCFITLYDYNDNKFFSVNEYSEYLADNTVKSTIGMNIRLEDAKYFYDIGNKQLELIINDIDEDLDVNDEDQLNAYKYLKNLNVKTNIGISMMHSDKLLGRLVIHYKDKMSISDEYLQFIKTIVNQATIALYQAELFQKEKNTAEREYLLRAIIERLRTKLDSEQIKNYFIEASCKFLGSDRCIFLDIDEENNRFKPVKLEYLKASEVKSLYGHDLNIFSPDFARKGLNKEDIIIEDMEKFLSENKDLEPITIKFNTEFEVKSDYGFQLIHNNRFFGSLINHFTKEKRKLTTDELSFLKSFVNQASLALYQAEVYEKEKQAVERQQLLRKIIEIIRSTLDIDELFELVCNQLATVFNVQRSFIVKFSIDKAINIRGEFKIRPEIKGMTDKAFDKKTSEYWGTKLFEEDKPIIIDNISKSDTPDYFKETYTKIGVKSIMGFPIKEGNDKWGWIGVAEYAKYRHWTKEEVELLETISSQIYIAIKQAELYGFQKETAEKERILRSIVSELKPFKDVEEAFKYLLAKIANIYDVPRTLLIEVPILEYENSKIAYEYIKNEEVISLKNSIIPNEGLEILSRTDENLSPIIEPNINYLYADNKEVLNFFETFSIESYIATPLVRYNHEIKILGILLIFDDKKRNWSKKEINLLKAINESVVNILWELLKTIELNRLRDSFINTLTHDLQVPIIGDIKALEFISSKLKNQSPSILKEIIDETIINDKRILNILKMLMNSYEYESGKKELKKLDTEWISLINRVVASLTTLAEGRFISLEIQLPDQIPNISIDRAEIHKALFIFLENAIMYTNSGDKVIIRTTIENNYLKTCIIDNGPGIPSQMKDSIFKRYEMSIEIERKIGAGISLYLAKQIVKAHGGKVSFSSNSAIGSTFCLLLPINRVGA